MITVKTLVYDVETLKVRIINKRSYHTYMASAAQANNCFGINKSRDHFKASENCSPLPHMYVSITVNECNSLLGLYDCDDGSDESRCGTG